MDLGTSPRNMAAAALNVEKLEKLLRRAKVTQQSIQAVSSWVLDKRAHLAEIVDVWARLMREMETAQQVVYWYIANDIMQVGVRKYGRHIAEFFEAKLPELVQLVMTQGEEKAKRCLIKIVGIWKDRHTINPLLLGRLELVCAGKPYVEETSDDKPVSSVEDQVQAALDAFKSSLLTEQSMERSLEAMPEVVEAEETVAMTQRLQSVVTATISADLLSDRLFQLESSLSTFHHALEASSSHTDTDMDAQPKQQAASSNGGIAWEMLDQQVFDLDIERSREHVQQYRDNIEQQNAKRDELLDHLRSLLDFDPFIEPIFHSTPAMVEQEEATIERLLALCLRAEHRQRQQQEERQQQAHSYTSSYVRTSASPRDGSRDSMPASRGYEAPIYSPHNVRFHEPIASHDAYMNPQDAPHLRRYSSNDAYEYSYPTPAKRSKLSHSQSFDERRSPSARSPRWQQQPPPQQGLYPPPQHGYRDEYDARYASGPQYSQQYSPRDARMQDDMRYAPSPRTNMPPRASRWDTRPNDLPRDQGRW